MELEQFQDWWTKYDKKLEKSLEINEDILRQITIQKSRNEIRKPLVSEWLTIIPTLMFIIYILSLSTLLFNEYEFSIPGFISGFSALVLVIFAFIRIGAYEKMDYQNQTLLDLQKQIFKMEKMRYRSGIWEVILGALTILGMIPLILITGFETDIYQNGRIFLFSLSIILLISIPVAIWHEKFYRRKLRNASILLENIQDLEEN